MSKRKLDESERHEAAAKYMPTQDEIRDMCAEIRKEWGAETESRRRAPDRPIDLGNVHRIVEDDE